MMSSGSRNKYTPKRGRGDDINAINCFQNRTLSRLHDSILSGEDKSISLSKNNRQGNLLNSNMKHSAS